MLADSTTVPPEAVRLFPLASLSVTVIVAVWPAVRFALLVPMVDWGPAAAPTVPVAVNVRTLPVNGPDVTVAVIEFAPVPVPRVQLPTVAMPDAFVVVARLVPDP